MAREKDLLCGRYIENYPQQGLALEQMVRSATCPKFQKLFEVFWVKRGGKSFILAKNCQKFGPSYSVYVMVSTNVLLTCYAIEGSCYNRLRLGQLLKIKTEQ